MQGNQGDKNLVSGDWWLTFDLPEEWVVYAPYDEDQGVPQDVEVTRELNDVILQSTSLPVILDGDEPGELVTAYEDESYLYAHVYRYDPRTSVPDDAEDLGNGFYKQVKDNGDIVYYFVGENGKYRFLVEQEGQDLSELESVILTAKEVTDLE